MQKQILTLKEVAELFNCSENTIRNNIGKPNKRFPQPRNLKTKAKKDRYEWLIADVEKFLKRDELPDTHQLEQQSKLKAMITEIVDERLAILFSQAKAS